jgi:hypothetical protein
LLIHVTILEKCLLLVRAFPCMKRIWNEKHNVNSLDSDFIKHLFTEVICVYLEYLGSFFVIRDWATMKTLGSVSPSLYLHSVRIREAE